MNDDATLSKLIAKAVEEARSQGLDYTGQTERAVKRDALDKLAYGEMIAVSATLPP